MPDNSRTSHKAVAFPSCIFSLGAFVLSRFMKAEEVLKVKVTGVCDRPSLQYFTFYQKIIFVLAPWSACIKDRLYESAKGQKTQYSSRLRPIESPNMLLSIHFFYVSYVQYVGPPFHPGSQMTSIILEHQRQAL